MKKALFILTLLIVPVLGKYHTVSTEERKCEVCKHCKISENTTVCECCSDLIELYGHKNRDI